MKCANCDTDETCIFWEKGHDDDAMGYDENGACCVQDDPDPYDSCELFEPAAGSE
jgi:hypothetical protein